VKAAIVRATVAVFAVTALFSCVSPPREPKPAELPGDLEAWIAREESMVPDLIPGDEKCIAWAGERGARTPLAIVYIHGWQGSPRDYEPVLTRLGAATGSNVYFARLAGYGVSGESIAEVELGDWLDETQEAFEIGRRIGDRVLVAGSSMGGNLALWLGSRCPEGLAGLLLFSCAVQPKDPRSEMLLWPRPLPALLLGAIVGRYNTVTWDGGRYVTGDPALFVRRNPPRYRSASTIRLMETVRLARELSLESIAVPSLWLYSEKDEAVDTETLARFFSRAGGSPKRLVRVEGTHGHMLAGDMFSPDTTDEVVEEALSFLRDSGLASK
jgi:pimeloyl-ACP methyl ester carboxylesterase